MVESVRVRNDWTREEVAALFARPLLDLLFEAQAVHRQVFAANRVEKATLLSIKTGGCPEDCGYCSQSARFQTGVKATRLLAVDAVIEDARRARDAGATRFCMGAAWRSPADRDLPALTEMIRGVRALGLETCMTLGMLTESQAAALGEAGLDWYNHNLDTSPEYYPYVVSTRTYSDRLQTLAHVRDAGIGVCCGGILGLGETREDHIGFIHALATLPEHPGSVPINALVPVAGTPLGNASRARGEAVVDGLEFVRTVAAARLTMPRSVVRLSAGREAMSDELQTLCFLAGANSIFSGDRLLTTANASPGRDADLLGRLGMEVAPAYA